MEMPRDWTERHIKELIEKYGGGESLFPVFQTLGPVVRSDNLHGFDPIYTYWPLVIDFMEELGVSGLEFQYQRLTYNDEFSIIIAWWENFYFTIGATEDQCYTFGGFSIDASQIEDHFYVCDWTPGRCGGMSAIQADVWDSNITITYGMFNIPGLLQQDRTLTPALAYGNTIVSPFGYYSAVYEGKEMHIIPTFVVHDINGEREIGSITYGDISIAVLEGTLSATSGGVPEFYVLICFEDYKSGDLGTTYYMNIYKRAGRKLEYVKYLSYVR